MTNNLDFSAQVNALDYVMFEVNGKMYGVGRDWLEARCQHVELEERCKRYLTEY